MAEHGAAVVTCPQSNAKLAAGRAPLAAMLRRGLWVALGADSAASNNSLDLFWEIDFAAKLHKVNPSDPTATPARHLLRMATWRVAATLGLVEGHGALNPGSPADLILINRNQPGL